MTLNYIKYIRITILGYKKQIAVDSNGLVLAVHTTAANEHDSKSLIPLLEKIDNERIKKGVFTDKGYASKANRNILREENPRTGYSIKHRKISR